MTILHNSFSLEVAAEADCLAIELRGNNGVYTLMSVKSRPKHDVRFTSKADICSALTHVRFVPIADIEAPQVVKICNDKRKFTFQETKEKAELSYHQTLFLRRPPAYRVPLCRWSTQQPNEERHLPLCDWLFCTSLPVLSFDSLRL